MKTEKEIKQQISFLKNAVKKSIATNTEEVARLNQITALEWVLEENNDNK